MVYRKIEKVVISGATSSIGVALIDECIKRNVFVLALVNPKSKNISKIPIHKNVMIRRCDLNDIKNYDMCENDYDAFFHLAWSSTHGDKERNNLQEHLSNIQYSLDAVDLSERLGCKVFIGAGSQAEYGRTEETMNENTRCNPETPYGIAKYCAGKMTRIACQNKQINHIWTRILSSFGPKNINNTVIDYTINELLNNRKPLLSDGKQIWDFIYSGDVANALYLLSEKGHSGDVYVIGSGHSEPLRDYLVKIKNIINPNMELGFGEKSHNDNAVMHLSCDITKLKMDTGFEIKTSFDDGVKKTVEWIQNKIKIGDCYGDK